MVSVVCFGVKDSLMFHLMFVHYTLSSVWVAEWPPFGKQLQLVFDCPSFCSLIFYYNVIVK